MADTVLTSTLSGCCSLLSAAYQPLLATYSVMYRYAILSVWTANSGITGASNGGSLIFDFKYIPACNKNKPRVTCNIFAWSATEVLPSSKAFLAFYNNNNTATLCISLACEPVSSDMCWVGRWTSLILTHYDVTNIGMFSPLPYHLAIGNEISDV